MPRKKNLARHFLTHVGYFLAHLHRCTHNSKKYISVLEEKGNSSMEGKEFWKNHKMVWKGENCSVVIRCFRPWTGSFARCHSRGGRNSLLRGSVFEYINRTTSPIHTFRGFHQKHAGELNFLRVLCTWAFVGGIWHQYIASASALCMPIYKLCGSECRGRIAATKLVWQASKSCDWGRCVLIIVVGGVQETQTRAKYTFLNVTVSINAARHLV